ncbi:TlpA disulfide reductase family protein [Chloroflexota bacterium]
MANYGVATIGNPQIIGSSMTTIGSPQWQPLSMKTLIFKYWTLFSIALLAACAVWIWFSRVDPDQASATETSAPHKGFLAPDFSLSTYEGEIITLSDLRGQPVLINLWTSWCPPCKAEMPALERVYQDFKDDGLEILAVNSTNQDNAADAIGFVQDLGLTFTVLFDNNGNVSKQYRLQALPTSIFINREGVIREIVIGGPMSEALLRTRIKTLIE